MLTFTHSGWVPNSDLIELDPETVLNVKMDKMRKDLQAAHKLAAENHPLQYFKGVLQEFQEDLLAKQKAKEAKAATPKKKKKEAEEAGDEDEEMADAEDGTEGKEKKSSKKRKAEENIEVMMAHPAAHAMKPANQLFSPDSSALRLCQEAQDQVN